MADFSTLDELLDTTGGMDALRSNTKQDDGTDAVTGVGWFQFNQAAATTLYVNGNSWVGFGAAVEQLKICRRDTAMYSLYRQEGTIGGATRFLKIRWEGYAAYNSTSSSYALKWELFLFDDGGMYLNLLDVPESVSYLGTSALACGGSTYPFAVTAGTAVGYSFYPQDGAGSAWAVAQEPYPITLSYKAGGYAQYKVSGLHVGHVAHSALTWDQSTPAGTAVAVKVSLDGAHWTAVANGGAFLPSGAVLEDATLSIRVELSTTDIHATPTLSNLGFTIQSEQDCYSIILAMDPMGRFESAAGQIL